MTSKRICNIYRSPRKAEMYLYVDKQKDLSDVPEALLAQFGEPALVMTLLIHNEKKLARVEAATVLEKIEAQGFYLQMPPAPDEYIVRADKASRRDSEAP